MTKKSHFREPTSSHIALNTGNNTNMVSGSITEIIVLQGFVEDFSPHSSPETEEIYSGEHWHTHYYIP